MPSNCDSPFPARGQSRRNGDAQQPVAAQLGARGAPKTVIIWLCVDELFRTDGTVSYIADVRDVPELRKIGPMISRLRVHHQSDAAPADFRAQVGLMWSVTGQIWSTPVVIYAAQAGSGQWIGSWYSTDANFGLNLRASIDVSNVAANPPVSGRLTIALEVELKS